MGGIQEAESSNLSSSKGDLTVVVDKPQGIGLISSILYQHLDNGDKIFIVRPINIDNYSKWYDLVARDLSTWLDYLPEALTIFNYIGGAKLVPADTEIQKVQGLSNQIQALKKLLDLAKGESYYRIGIFV